MPDATMPERRSRGRPPKPDALTSSERNQRTRARRARDHDAALLLIAGLTRFAPPQELERLRRTATFARLLDDAALLARTMAALAPAAAVVGIGAPGTGAGP